MLTPSLLYFSGGNIVHLSISVRQPLCDILKVAIATASVSVQRYYYLNINIKWISLDRASGGLAHVNNTATLIVI